jgi:hypothetical protein
MNSVHCSIFQRTGKVHAFVKNSLRFTTCSVASPCRDCSRRQKRSSESAHVGSFEFCNWQTRNESVVGDQTPEVYHAVPLPLSCVPRVRKRSAVHHLSTSAGPPAKHIPKRNNEPKTRFSTETTRHLVASLYEKMLSVAVSTN